MKYGEFICTTFIREIHLAWLKRQKLFPCDDIAPQGDTIYKSDIFSNTLISKHTPTLKKDHISHVNNMLAKRQRAGWQES